MICEVAVKESTQVELELDSDQAMLLRRLGSELAASRSWWGEDGAPSSRSIVDVQSRNAKLWTVTFREVVGVVRLGDLQIRVVPKISQRHFNFLVRHSDLAPRLARQQVNLDHGEDLANLVARWCVGAAERVLHKGLRVDYREERDELQQVRGRLDPIATSLAIGVGRPVAICDFEELDEDMPLNRIVKAACRLVSGSGVLSPELRQRARNVVHRLEHVGELRHEDRKARLDRLTKSYEEVLPLATMVLDAGGIQSRIGGCVGSAFLLRTPEIIEDGVRSVIADLVPELDVKKRKLVLGDSGLSLNPDLVFLKGAAVGDVKYRFLGRDWDRPSLNQAVTFATGFGAAKCGVVGFTAAPGTGAPRAVQVGVVEARSFAWDAREVAEPTDSAQEIADEIKSWLGGLMSCEQ